MTEHVVVTLEGDELDIKPVHKTRCAKQPRYHENMHIEARYNIKLKPQRKPVRPIPLDLSSEAGRRRFLEAAKRVMETHADVLAALARR